MLWLNGTFGVGKTTTAKSIAAMADRWRVFDAELVGYMLRAYLHGYMLRAYLDGVDCNDFQDLSAWRRLVPSVAREVASLTTSDLLVVQSVLNVDYWSELMQGMEREGLEVFHVLLDCDESVLRERISDDEHDPGALEWRMHHVDAYRTARGRMVEAADLVVDTASADPAVVASRILQALR